MTEGVVMLLTGPLQSWGGPSASIYERSTASAPSLSGIVGIVANALGRSRTDGIDDLARGATLAVRVDRPGTLMEDYHTIGSPGRYALNTEGKLLPNSVPTRRWYLQDAAFVAVFTPPSGGMPAIEVLRSLENPVRPLYLGRRSCTPSERIPVCVTGGRDPLELLSKAALLRDAPPNSRIRDADYYRGELPPEGSLSVIIEMSATAEQKREATLRADVPETFDPRRLFHMHRRVVTKAVSMSVSSCTGRNESMVFKLYESLGVEP